MAVAAGAGARVTAGAEVVAGAGVVAGMGTRTRTVTLPVGVGASIHTILPSCPSGSFKIKISIKAFN